MTDQTSNTPPSDAPPTPWYSDANKTFVESKGFKTADDALVSLQNAEKLIGMDRAGRAIYKPKDDNDADGIKAFRAALGVPEKAEDYKLPVPEGDDGKYAGVVASWFHEAGIPTAAAQTLAKKQNEYIAKLVAEEQAAERAEGERQLAALKTDWGDSFSANTEHAKRFLKASGLTDEQVGAIEGALGAAAMLKVFHQWGTRIGESAGVEGERRPGFSGGKAEIQQKIDELRQKRLQNQIGERDYLSQLETLSNQLAA